MSAAAEPVLELRGLSAGYGRTTVIREVSIEVNKGEVAALLGANGAGKTTLLSTVAGLLRPSQGSVWLGGREISAMAVHQRVRAGLCLIPEGRGIFPRLSVRDNLALQVPPWSEGGIEPALEAFPILSERLGQSAGTMSGGQQQMLALARAYLAEPQVIMLDEVSMGLAPRVVDQIFESIAALAARGAALLLVEQYVNRALEMAQTVHLLDRGQISLTARASELDQDSIVRRYLGGAESAGEGAARPG
jgi:branched-chain amino acid transport system ATP-binding protein